jgi:uncharacterized protein involved in outer membrane biogenesis
MKKAFKSLAFVFFIGVLLAVALSLAFYRLVRVGEFRRFVVTEVEQQTQLKVQLGEAHLEIGRIVGIAFHDVALTDPDATQPAITAERVTARVALLPLLERKLVFYEIRLQKPVARLTRDQDGRIPLLDKILNLQFLTRHGASFSLDLRSIRLTGAQIDFTTELNSGTQSTVRLSGAEAEIGRIRGEPLRTFIRDAMKWQRTESRGIGLNFQLDTAVEKDGVKGHLSAHGKMLFAAEAVEFHNAWWDGDLRLVDIPTGVLQQFAGGDLGIGSMTGHLAQRLHITGTPTRRLRISGNLEFRRLAIEAPTLFKQPVLLGDGHTEFAVDWSPERVELTRVFFRTNETKFSLEGEVRELNGNDPYYRLNLSGLSIPVGRLREIVPLQALASPQVERWATLFSEGELQLVKGGLNARSSQIRRMVNSGISERLWFEAEIRNAAGRLALETALPLTDVQARLTLERGVLSVRNLKARYGQSRISDLDAKIKDFAAGPGDLEVQARGEADLGELQQQLKQEVFPAQINKFADSVRQLSGRARIDLSLRRSTAPLQLAGVVAVENARMQIGDLLLTDVKGDLSVSPKEIKSEKVRATLSASPVELRLQLKDYATDNGTFDLLIDSPRMRAGAVTQWLLGTGSPHDPGIVRGSLRYQGGLTRTDGRTFSGQLDLANVQVAVEPLLQPLRELNGRVRIDERGVDFQNIEGLLVGSPAAFSGRWRFGQKPQLLFDFTAPNLDVSALLAQLDPEATDFYANLQALGKISLGKGRLKALEFSDFKSDVVIDRRVWRFINPSLRSAGGSVKGVMTVTDKPDTLVVSATPDVQAVPVESFLRWFGMSNSDMSGKVNLTGTFESTGENDAERKRNLAGSFKLKIEDGTIHRLRIVIQLLNLLDLSRWFTLQMPDLTKQGIRFRSITGDFKIANGVYATENLVVDSDDLRMTGQGRIDVPNDQIDFVIAVRPFAGIDTVIGYIPVIGRGISAIKNSFLVGSFNVRGPIDDPTITPAPLSTLSEVFLGVLGIPKNVIGTGAADRKEPRTEQNADPSRGDSAASPR